MHKNLQETPEQRWARVSAKATAWMAGLTFVLAAGAIGNIILLYVQLDEAKKNDANQARAWMVVEATGYSEGLDFQRVSRANAAVTLKNVGNSPAIHAAIARCTEVRDKEPDFNNLSAPNCIYHELGVVGKDIPIPTLSYDQSYQVPAGGVPPSMHLYVWGRVVYNVTTDSSDHTTSFCLVHEGSTQLSPCNKGNIVN